MVLPAAQQALARGKISPLKWEIDELLKVFRINLDPECASYRELGMAVLKEFVRALQDVARRHKGEPVNTPVLPEPSPPAVAVRVRSLRAALEGWTKARGVAQRPSFASLTTRLRGLSNCMMICPSQPSRASMSASSAKHCKSCQSEEAANCSEPLFRNWLPWSKTHPEAPKLSNATITSSSELFRPSRFGAGTTA